MLTPRKTAIVVAFLLTFVYFIHSLKSPSSTPSTQTSEPAKSKEDGIAYPQSTGRLAGTVAESGRVYPPPRKDPNAQQTLKEGIALPLRDLLRLQFPYDGDGKFPAYIWQTWKYLPSDGHFSDELRPAEASWTELHPGFIHEVLTDEPAANLIKYLYASIPGVLEAYESLPVPVLKADFFRYLILLARGGIYSDIDTFALKSTTEWIPADVPRSTIGLVIGIEADPDRPDWHDWYSRRIQFCQWTIQAKAGHPVLRDVVATITEDTLRMKKLGILKAGKMDKSIVEFTGPAVWTDAVFSYINSPAFFKMEPGSRNITAEHFTGMTKSRKVGDVVVLPITSFSPGVQQMGAQEADDPMAFVKHEFEGEDIDTPVLPDLPDADKSRNRYLEASKRANARLMVTKHLLHQFSYRKPYYKYITDLDSYLDRSLGP
ncbi:membrane-bound alpha-1,6- mannosyltransferase Initiation-specific [Bachmanniomyces sp. S44760]|nr:membrane-bound alpha-1,6- mannosyltransferase Initiation-specific [Bachmanniomyces sp. S44760]